MPKEGYADVYGSEFVAPDDIPRGKKFTLLIAGHNVQMLQGFANGKKLDPKKKVVFTCTDAKGKPCKAKIAVNKTSAKRLRAAWGEDFDAWVGKSITVETGLVQGKPAVLLTPVQDKAAPVATSADVDDLSIPDEAIPE